MVQQIAQFDNAVAYLFARVAQLGTRPEDPRPTLPGISPRSDNVYAFADHITFHDIKSAWPSLVNPEGLPKVDTYRQVSVATGSKLVFIAGQVASRSAKATSLLRLSSATSTSPPPGPRSALLRRRGEPGFPNTRPTIQTGARTTNLSICERKTDEIL